MMTMSRAISAGQASNYYKQEFTNSQDNYYREAGEVQGRWCGTLAEEWNLKGEVTSEQYDRLAAGQDPHTGEQLIRVVSARETVNKFGDEITTSEHRAAWDATMAADRAEPLIMAAWWREFARALYADELGDAFRGNWNARAVFVGNVLSGQSHWCDDVRTPLPEGSPPWITNPGTIRWKSVSS